MYISVSNYAKKHNITRQAVYDRIKSGNISPDRIQKDDAGKIVIKERNL
jgi:predicted DNA-binding protein YlxM (UPF0122 family)